MELLEDLIFLLVCHLIQESDETRVLGGACTSRKRHMLEARIVKHQNQQRYSDSRNRCVCGTHFLDSAGLLITFFMGRIGSEMDEVKEKGNYK